MTAFVFVRGATTWWPVNWNEPVDGGSVAAKTIELRFKRTPWGEELAALFRLETVEFINAVATDWRGIADDAGRPVPFDDEAIIEMAHRPAFAEALGPAYLAFIRALPETRQGNSAASLAGGPAANEAVPADGAPTETPA